MESSPESSLIAIYIKNASASYLTNALRMGYEAEAFSYQVLAEYDAEYAASPV